MQLVNAERPAPTPPPPRRRFGWLRRGAIDLGDIVVQVFSVVIGILLALAINQWSATRSKAEHVTQANAALALEVATNDAHVEKSLALLVSISDKMSRNPPPAGSPELPCNQYSSWAGIPSVLLLDAAYQTSIASQALAEMSFEDAQRIAYTYAMQHEFEKGYAFTLQFLGNERPMSFAGCEHVVGVEYRNQLVQLHETYQTFLDHGSSQVARKTGSSTPQSQGAAPR